MSIIEKDSAPFDRPDFIKLLEESRANFHLYGINKEIEVFEKFIKSCERKELQNANESLKELREVVRIGIREVLRINK